jgi:hypothetical protein
MQRQGATRPSSKLIGDFISIIIIFGGFLFCWQVLRTGGPLDCFVGWELMIIQFFLFSSWISFLS